MRRRDLLQLAVGAAAVAVVPESFAWSDHSPGCFLHLQHLSLPVGTQETLISIAGDLTPARSTPASSLQLIEMIWERKFDSPVGHYQWVVNGKLPVENRPLRLLPSQGYRLRVMNATGEKHLLHLDQAQSQRNRFALERYSAMDIEIAHL